MLQSESLAERPWVRHRVRVPREDNTLIARPELSEAVEQTCQNRSALDATTISVQGRSLAVLRKWARHEVVQAAAAYTSELIGQPISGVRNNAADDRSGSAPVPRSGVASTEISVSDTGGENCLSFETIVTGGHQPSLFHPGVWVKNFAIHGIAEQTNGIALNLVIDNDTHSSKSLNVPAGNREQPQVERIAFDRERSSVPWEDAQILDQSMFQTFGDRIATAMSHWGVSPLLTRMWPDAAAHAQTSNSLRDCLTVARNRMERRWGIANLELPISRLCTLDPFLWFAGHVFAQLPRFREIHNETLLDYRRINRIRSRTHPVPELKQADDWLEAPFWVWRTGERQRSRVFARQVGREVQLSDGQKEFARLPLSPEMDACCAVEVLRELPAQGIRLRTRALTTTLFARLCFSDLFVHGIGGAKYDEMTDRIITRFFGMSAPSFLTLSATLLLPTGEPHPVAPADDIRLQGLLRDLRYNSDRHLVAGADEQTDSRMAEKQSLISEQQLAKSRKLPRRERRSRSRNNAERYRRLKLLNQELAKLTEDQRLTIQAEREDIRTKLAANAILTDREYAFCLFPEQKLRPFMTNLWNQ